MVAHASTNDGLLTVDGVVEAAARLHGLISPTPAYRSVALSNALDADVWLKVETVTPVACFKLRGALNALLVAKERGLLEAVVTSSTGNHGQAVACAAQMLGLKADIFVPENTVAVKKAMISLFGGVLHEGGRDIDEAKDRARAFAGQHNALFVDDGESVDVINGAGTIGIEVAQAVQGVDYMFVPLGSGSLAAGTAVALKASQPNAKVIAVQSEGSRAMHDSFKLGQPVERPVDTIGDCIVCRVPARLALDGLIRHVDDVELVQDADLLSAMQVYMMRGHLLVEPGSASALAGAIKRRGLLRGKRVVLVVTGSNADGSAIASALSAEDPLRAMDQAERVRVSEPA